MLLLSLALASELRPVRAGETVESIAAERGDASLAPKIRALNGLADGAQPLIGTMLELPPPEGFHSDQEAFLISLQGEGTFTDQTGTEAPAVVWKPIPNNTVVCTDTQSTATLRLASTCNDDGSASDDIVLNAETCLSVQSSFSSAAGRSTVVQITSGSISVVASETDQGHVTVVTPSGITTGAQGGYRVTVEDEAARTEAIDAPVAVAGAGAEVKVNKGQGTRVRAGEVPMEPIDLLPPPEPLAPEDQATLKRLRFTWRDAPDAFAYRIEMGTSPGFSETLYVEDLTASPYAPGMLLFPTNGRDTLFWRIAVFDRLGFLGMPSEPRSFLLPKAVTK